jgi:hygromycin-B 4-O-kinase
LRDQLCDRLCDQSCDQSGRGRDPYHLTVDSVADIDALLRGQLGFHDACDVESIGAGAWSQAFGFVGGGRSLVIRVGAHVTDFRRDEAMATLATPTLPIPEVLGVGRIADLDSADLWYCISTRAFGVPLETCPSDEWPALCEEVADVLEAMRLTSPVAATRGQGASTAPWRDQLLQIERDDLDARGAGWPAQLALSARGSAAFDTGFVRLRSLDIGAVEPALVHGDLINRNVHVDAGRITGIFDWGCQRWGDHLFDLAWFEFWSPWYPNLDIDLLRSMVRTRWDAAGYSPEHEGVRFEACLLYIGLEHLIYNATIAGWDGLDQVVDRMTSLDLL